MWSNEQDEQNLPSNLDQLLIKTASHVAERLVLPAHAEVSVTFVTDAAMTELNSQYRGMSGPTDVLSFAFSEGEEVSVPEGAPLMLGDIIISARRAQAQALEFGHSFEREIVFLLVHGLLHLVGYDHDEANEGEMMVLNEEIASELGYER